MNCKIYVVLGIIGELKIYLFICISILINLKLHSKASLIWWFLGKILRDFKFCLNRKNFGNILISILIYRSSNSGSSFVLVKSSFRLREKWRSFSSWTNSSGGFVDLTANRNSTLNEIQIFGYLSGETCSEQVFQFPIPEVYLQRLLTLLLVLYWHQKSSITFF